MKVILKNDVFFLPKEAIHLFEELYTGNKLKKEAEKVLGYIYYFYDIESPYAHSSVFEKEELIKENYLKFSNTQFKNFKENNKHYFDKYEKFSITQEERLLKSMIHKIDEIENYFLNKSVDDEFMEKADKYTKVINSLLDTKKLYIEKLEKSKSNNKTRGNKQRGLLEQGKI